MDQKGIEQSEKGFVLYSEEDSPLLELRYENIDSTYANLTATAATASATAKSTSLSISVTATLQRRLASSTSYSSTGQSWTKSGTGYASISGTPSYSSGYVYRLKVDVSCSGESVTVYSGTYTP